MNKEQRESLDKIKTEQELKKLEQESFRLFVVERELNARANKAEFERMYYYLEARKIEPEYDKQVREDFEKRQELQKEKEVEKPKMEVV